MPIQASLHGGGTASLCAASTQRGILARDQSEERVLMAEHIPVLVLVLGCDGK